MTKKSSRNKRFLGANQAALQKAVKIAGGQRALGRLLGLEQGHIWSWLYRTGQVPAEYAIAVEAAVDGGVTRYALRPDIYPTTMIDLAKPTTEQLSEAIGRKYVAKNPELLHAWKLFLKSNPQWR